MTDYGACCVIVPYLDLVNTDTINLDPALYSGDLFHKIPKGAKNGLQNGLKLVLCIFDSSDLVSPKNLIHKVFIKNKILRVRIGNNCIIQFTLFFAFYF